MSRFATIRINGIYGLTDSQRPGLWVYFANLNPLESAGRLNRSEESSDDLPWTAQGTDSFGVSLPYAGDPYTGKAA